MSLEPRLYQRGSRGIWWVDFGEIGGIRQRRSTNETTIEKAQRAAESMRHELDRHRRQLRLVTLTSTTAPSDWADFIVSPAGVVMVKRLWRNAHGRSKRDGLAWCLSEAECRTMLLSSAGKCAVTGLALSRTVAARDAYKPSIDRVDNSLGYSRGNCRITLMAVNLAMNVWGADTFKTIALAFASRELQALAQICVQVNSQSEMRA